MKTIKLWFSDFYNGFEPENNFFYNHLSQLYNIVLDEQNPDFLIYSCYGNKFFEYSCVRIFYTGENLKPDFNLCDYAIGFDYITFDKRYLRFPNFAFYEKQFEQLVQPGNKPEEIASKKYFCNFIYSNPSADPVRDQFFQLLSKYKKVISPGSHLNNISLPVGKRFAKDWMFSKIDFQSSCKFSIAFENSSSPGYTTEKLLHSFISGTIPIYWGNPEVEKDFNSKAFINCHNFPNWSDIVERIREIDNDLLLYESILNEPPFRNNTIPPNLETETLLKFLKSIFDNSPENALKRPAYGTTIKYEKNLKDLIKLKSKVSKINKLFRFRS